MMPLIPLLMAVLVGCVLIWAIRSLLKAFSIGDPIATVVQIIVVLIVLLWLIQTFGLLRPWRLT